MLSGFEQALLGVLVIVLMVGMGATLDIDSFRAVLRRPKGLLIGLLSQFGWMPLCAFALSKGLGLPNAVALSLVIVGCTPGGTTSNLFTYYSRADLALSISMTVASTAVAVVMMPLVLWIYATPFTTAAIKVPFGKVISTLVVVLVPVIIGVAIRRKSVRWATIIERVGSIAGIVVLLLLVGSGLLHNYNLLLSSDWRIYAACIGLGAIGMALGYAAARASRLEISACRAVALETGIQNSPLAIAIVIVSFAESLHLEMLRLPLMYALFVLLTSSIVTLVFRFRDKASYVAVRAEV